MELHDAARTGDMVRLTALLSDEACAKGINTVDKHRRTPLHLAAFFGKALAVERLLERRADADCEAMDGFLPLHFAAQSGHVDVVRLLLRSISAKGDHGAIRRHVNRVVRKNKKSALHLAVSRNHQECARLLLSRGASTQLKTGKGETAVDLCKSDKLRQELQGETILSAAGSCEESLDSPAKRRALEGWKSAGANNTEPAAAAAAERPPMSGLPARPIVAPAAAVPGLLAGGPMTLNFIKVSVANADRSYPTGVAALADIHWFQVSKEVAGLVDGPVWCLSAWEKNSSHDDRQLLHLELQRSNRRLLDYTERSDEGRLLPKSLRCPACGITVLMESADGFLIFLRQPLVSGGRGGAGQVVGSAIESCTLDDADLARFLSRTLHSVDKIIGNADDAFASARCLGLLESDEQPLGSPLLTGHHYELIFGVRLVRTAAELAKAYAEVRGTQQGSKEEPGSLVAFVPSGSSKAEAGKGAGEAETFARFYASVDEALAVEPPALSSTSRRALTLLQHLHRAASSGP